MYAALVAVLDVVSVTCFNVFHFVYFRTLAEMSAFYRVFLFRVFRVCRQNEREILFDTTS